MAACCSSDESPFVSHRTSLDVIYEAQLTQVVQVFVNDLTMSTLLVYA